MTNEQAGSSKKIHLHVASGSKVRALLHDNIIHCATVPRPLISVGQMKSMLDLRFVWNDSSPLLLGLGMLGRSQICVVGSDNLPQSARHHFS